MMTGQPAPTPPTAESGGAVEAPKQEALQSTPFSQLAKKEAEIVRQREIFKREKQAIEAEKTKLAEINKQIKLYEDTKKTDPIAALKMIGFSETDIFNYMAANEQKEPTPEERAAKAAEAAAEAKIKAFEEQQKQRIIAEQKERDTTLIKGFKSDIANTIKTNSEKYEYCNYYGPEAEALAYEITLATLKTSGGKDVLTPQEAIQMAEEYFENKDKEMATLKKRNPTPPPVEAPPSAERSRTVTPGFPNQEQPKPTVTKTRTLTNAATPTAASMRRTGPESREQKRERLMNALRNGSL